MYKNYQCYFNVNYFQEFIPQAVYDENSEVDESVLLKVIALHQVSDAITVYSLLEKKSVGKVFYAAKKIDILNWSKCTFIDQK